ncbi:MAG: helix-turn-helix domain-containing protein [Actinomycetota bacterium]|nr:helix-turn-helix domain-containing protein [Actinomycetota bacterium]
MDGVKPPTDSASRRRPWEDLTQDALSAWSPHLPGLADEIIAAIRAEVPAYALPLEGAFGQAVRRGVGEALGQFGEMVRNPDGGRAAGRSVYVALGRGEARAGRSLEALLAAYRVGARIAWRRLAAAGLAAKLAPETLALLAESIFAYIDELSAESAEGFAQEQADRAGETDRRRAAVVELLVRTPPPPEDVLVAAAADASWRLPQQLAVVVWRVEGARRPNARLPTASISGPVEALMCAVVPDPEGSGRRAELARAFEGMPAGMGSVVPYPEAARSFDRARAALSLAEERSLVEMLVAGEHRIALLCRAERSLVEEIAADRLQPLGEETEASRRRLEATLLAWLRCDGNVAAAALELHVHQQTVRYRLTRLRELFGQALDAPDVRFELEVALRAADGARDAA